MNSGNLKKKIFILLLTLSLVFSFTISPFGEELSETNTGNIVSKQTDKEATTPEKKSKTSTVKIMLVGDLMCSFDQQYTSYDGTDFDFYGEFEQIQPIFDQADILVGNLEVNIAKSYPLTKDMPMSLDKPYLNAPFEWLEAIQKAGFDGLITANNHCCDCGADGIKETIEAINEVGIKHTGTYKSSKSNHYFILEANNIKVGFLAYACYFNQKEDLLSSNELSYMLSPITKSQVQKDIKALKKAGAEYIIAYCHSGTEYTHKVHDRQKQYAKILFDCGVDYMINSHSHCLQKYTTISNKKRTMPVWYGMGNFTSSMSRDISRQTVITSITLSKNKKTGKVTLKEEGYYPLVQVRSYEGKPYVLLPESLGSNLTEEQSFYDDIKRTIGSSKRIKVYQY